MSKLEELRAVSDTIIATKATYADAAAKAAYAAQNKENCKLKAALAKKKRTEVCEALFCYGMLFVGIFTVIILVKTLSS